MILNLFLNVVGVEMFHNLEFLDISSNCLVSFDDILPLSMSQSLASVSFLFIYSFILILKSTML